MQLHNLYNQKVEIGDIMGITDPDAWNWNPNATFNYGNAVYAEDFVRNECVIPSHPNVPGLNSNNYIDSASLEFPLGSEGVFYSFDINSDEIQTHAKAYYDGGGIPIIYTADACEWDGIVPAEIENINISDFENVPMDSMDSMALSYPYPYEYPALKIPMTYKRKDNYLESGKFSSTLKIKFKTSTLPTFTNVLVTVSFNAGIPFVTPFTISENSDTVEIDINNEFLTTEEINSLQESFSFVSQGQPFNSTIEFTKNINIKVTPMDEEISFEGEDVWHSTIIDQNIILSFQSTNPLDYNSDGLVSMTDFGILLSNILSGSEDEIYDINQSGNNNSIDLATFSNWLIVHGDN